jgi:hypothetical protein
VTESRDPAAAPPPPVTESRDPGAPASESRKLPPYMPRASDSAFRAPQLRPPVPPAPRPAEAPPRVRFERIAALSGNNVTGRVLTAGRAPRAGARVLFVSAEKRGEQRTVAADRDGKFNASLGAGDWLVYVYNPSGKPVFYRRIEVRAKIPMPLTIVSR